MYHWWSTMRSNVQLCIHDSPVGTNKTVSSAVCDEQRRIREQRLAFGRYAEALNLDTHAHEQIMVKTKHTSY